MEIARPKRLFFLGMLLTIKTKISDLGMACKFRDRTHYQLNASCITAREKSWGDSTAISSSISISFTNFVTQRKELLSINHIYSR